MPRGSRFFFADAAKPIVLQNTLALENLAARATFAVAEFLCADASKHIAMQSTLARENVGARARGSR